jgi:serine/threonine-protein kinase HipA
VATLPASLSVSLGDIPVGLLSLDHNGAVEFRWLRSYLQTFPRPVLGQLFLDDPDAVLRSRSRLPPWFSNLLPEGALRELIAEQAGFQPVHEYALLNVLGQDLPGAVRVQAADDMAVPVDAHIEASDPSANGDDWHFSLAGVQLKFSARRTERGLTIPVSGLGGDWIVKLPDARFTHVPANEFATMSWARASGIETPESVLVPLSEIAGLPASIAVRGETQTLAVKRFDRPLPGQRVHIEDFAQVLGVYPEHKYKGVNYETLASIVLALSGEDGLRDYLRRLVFVVASGNGDAHLKNWSLIYPGGVTARLSPAYDQVSTIQYMPGDKLALNLGRSKQWADVTMARFQRLARKLDIDERTVIDTVEESVHVIRQAWLADGKARYTTAQQQIIEEHWRSVPLLG